MDKLEIRYRTAHKGLPPQPIRIKMPGWGGSAAMKMENGSEPQPWHCPPFVEGATYGLELVYHYETECHVINDKGDVRFEWDYGKEPGGIAGPDEFGLFAPKPAKFYSFGTSVDLKAPPGFVLRTQPHPRFFTDDTGTVPLAVVGHVQTEWWAKKLFVVFRVPPPGHRHIFRKNEPYVQLLFVPDRIEYEISRMDPEEEAGRRQLDDDINLSKPYIAKHVWHNPAGSEFSDHYKVLSRAYARAGLEEVEQIVRKAVEHRRDTLPMDKSVAEYFELADRYEKQRKFVEAKAIYFRIRRLEPRNPEAASRLGLLAARMGLPTAALQAMTQAVALQPNSSAYRHNLGETLRRLGRYQEAEASFRAALQLSPNDPQAMSNLGLTLAQQGRHAEGLEACRAAVAAGAHIPIVQYRLGRVLAQQHRHDEAREAFSAALAVDPNFAPASEALRELPTASSQTAPRTSA